ncbi:hypothetical protein GBA52_003846 [Prunus armeniaca]|nr:hypothetical protein GBA52_003846 [Prunus armeniaca]
MSVHEVPEYELPFSSGCASTFMAVWDVSGVSHMDIPWGTIRDNKTSFTSCNCSRGTSS